MLVYCLAWCLAEIYNRLSVKSISCILFGHKKAWQLLATSAKKAIFGTQFLFSVPPLTAAQCIEKDSQVDNFVYIVNTYLLTYHRFIRFIYLINLCDIPNLSSMGGHLLLVWYWRWNNNSRHKKIIYL